VLSAKKVKDLIKTLQDINPQKEIEYIVVGLERDLLEGDLLTVNISQTAKDMSRVLKIFDGVTF